MRVSVEQHLDGIDKLGEKAARRRVTSSIAMRLKTVMERYVPMREGALRHSAGIHSRFEEGDIVYATPYAEKQYRLRTQNRTTPGTDGEWDVEAMRERRDAMGRYAAWAVLKEIR